MKNKKVAFAIAAILTSNSMAFGAVSALETLKQEAKVTKPEDLIKLLEKADQNTANDLLMTYNEVQKLAATLRSIQNTNENDTLLTYANYLQVALVSVTFVSVNSHMKDSEKSRIALHVAAASAIINTFTRHYSEVKGLKPAELGVFINRFTHEMADSKALTPEMMEMADSLNRISNDLLAQKTQIDSLVTAVGGGSDLATGLLLLLAVAHYINPKLAKEGEAMLKTMSQKAAAGGAGLAKDNKVVGITGGSTGIPDLIGMALGMNSQKSQEMISKTLNNLDIASRNLKIQIQTK